jgi:transposase
MRQKSETRATSEQIVKDIRRATRKHHSAEEKIRVVLEGLRGEYSIAELCRREGIAESLYYSWSKEFLEAGKKRVAYETSIPPNFAFRLYRVASETPCLRASSPVFAPAS